jgi:ADP-ribose pyrophosphatase YjhB (NUDIX family)
MMIETSNWQGRVLSVTWRDSSFCPPRELTTQASGLCFTSDGRIVVVSLDGETWQLPGGHPEPGESIEAAFVREVAEEACASVLHLFYLGAQEVHDPQNMNGMPVYYQTRFWARVFLEDFRPAYEVCARKYVLPEELGAVLQWRTTRILDTILQSALALETRFGVK